MSTLFELVVDVVARSAVWLAVVAAASAMIGVGAARLIGRVTGDRPAEPARVVLWAVTGALVAASLAHRFGWPEPWAMAVWGRPLHPLWAAAGALLASAALAAVLRRRQRASTPAG